MKQFKVGDRVETYVVPGEVGEVLSVRTTEYFKYSVFWIDADIKETQFTEEELDFITVEIL